VVGGGLTVWWGGGGRAAEFGSSDVSPCSRTPRASLGGRRQRRVRGEVEPLSVVPFTLEEGARFETESKLRKVG
jgi:hypothetical protein